MSEVFLVSACRTPIGRFLGGLSRLRAPELGGLAVAEALARAAVPPDLVHEVILGNVLQAGVGQNPARQAMRLAGIPDSVAPYTVNMVCGSGLKAVMLAVQAIKAGDQEIVVAGGMESMSQAPYLLPAARQGARLGDTTLVDAMIHDGLWDVYSNKHMGLTGELVAEEYKIDRAAQDACAAESHRRATDAWDAGRFDAETFTVEVPQRRKDPLLVTRDEGVRSDVSVESLGKMRAAFTKQGSVTAGNASQISDGASALVIASAAAVEKHQLQPLARITGYAEGGMAPEWVMMAPKVAVENFEQKTGMSRHDFDLIELNEAFAAASCALVQTLELEASKINVNGGAIAIGHPIGASGARILTTLVYALKDRGLKTGLAALCLGGGNAVVTSIELC